MPCSLCFWSSLLVLPSFLFLLFSKMKCFDFSVFYIHLEVFLYHKPGSSVFFLLILRRLEPTNRRWIDQTVSIFRWNMYHKFSNSNILKPSNQKQKGSIYAWEGKSIYAWINSHMELISLPLEHILAMNDPIQEKNFLGWSHLLEHPLLPSYFLARSLPCEHASV